MPLDSVGHALQVDHAARTAWRGLRGRREGEELFDAAVAAIGRYARRAAPCARRGQPARPGRAELQVVDGLARIETPRGRIGPFGIVRERGSGEPQRILRQRLVQAVEHHAQAIAFTQLPLAQGVGVMPARRALRTQAIGCETAGLRAPAEAQLAAAAVDLQVRAARTVVARPDVEIDGIRDRRLARSEDHAAGRTAMAQGQRPAQHFDAIQRRQREARRLALPVRAAGRNAVDDESDTPDAEGRPRTEAARLDLQVLRVVVAIQRGEARHPLQRLGQVHLALALAQGQGIDARDRARRRRLRARASDHFDAVEFRGVIGVLGMRLRERQAAGTGEGYGERTKQGHARNSDTPPRAYRPTGQKRKSGQTPAETPKEKAGLARCMPREKADFLPLTCSRKKRAFARRHAQKKKRAFARFFVSPALSVAITRPTDPRLRRRPSSTGGCGPACRLRAP